MMKQIINTTLIICSFFYGPNVNAFSLDMTNSEAINRLGYYNVSNMKMHESAYLQSRGFSVCKKDGMLMINGFSILQKERGAGLGYYKLYKGEEGIDVYESIPTLGYSEYHMLATRIASAKQCKFTFEQNKLPLIKINKIFGTDNLSSLIKKKEDAKRQAHKK